MRVQLTELTLFRITDFETEQGWKIFNLSVEYMNKNENNRSVQAGPNFIEFLLVPEDATQFSKWLKEHDLQDPFYEHDCKSCVFLGGLIDIVDQYRYDLYFCPQVSLTNIPTVIARFGSEGPHYTSGMGSPYPALIEARKRAINKGLYRPD